MPSDLRQRREPIRSKALREAARGEQCTLQIFGVCVGGTETTVLAHLHDSASFGMGQKADDTSAIFACFGCHNEIDGRTRRAKTSPGTSSGRCSGRSVGSWSAAFWR